MRHKLTTFDGEKGYHVQQLLARMRKCSPEVMPVNGQAWAKLPQVLR